MGNALRCLGIDNKLCYEPDKIKQEVICFFKRLYSRKERVRSCLGGLDLPKISNEEAKHLERPITEKDIKAAVWSCDSSRSPGYDGFNINFATRS